MPFLPILLVLSLFTVLSQAHAEEPIRLRMASMIPKNSAYHKAMMEMGQAWQKAQGGSASFTLFTDGTQGGEADIVRRMRIGQLNAALLSVVGLRDIETSVSALQSMPLMFRNWDEVDYVREHIRPELEEAFLKQGFVILAWGDAGWVRFFSRTEARFPEDYQALKMFAWAGEPEQLSIMKDLGYKPVSLETSDILPALQTGLIDVVPVTPFYALAAQFNRPAPYMLDLNWSPMVGALVVTRAAWNSMSPSGQAELRSGAARAALDIRAKARADVDASVATLEQRGLHVTRLTEEERARWQKFAESVYPQIRGRLVPAPTYDKVVSLLAQYRQQKNAP